MTKKPNFGSEIINWTNHYLILFEEVILYNLQRGKSPEEIIKFTQELNPGILYIGPALVAGFRKHTTLEERQEVLLKIEKESK